MKVEAEILFLEALVIVDLVVVNTLYGIQLPIELKSQVF